MGALGVKTRGDWELSRVTFEMGRRVPYQLHLSWGGEWFAFPVTCTCLVLTTNFIKGNCLRA